MRRLKILLFISFLLVLLLLAGLGIAIHWRPVLPGVAAPDAASQSDFDWDGLHAQFFGTSTVLISDGQTRLMCDGFLSRPAWWRLLVLPISPDEARIQQALTRAAVSQLDAVFVAHSHHDHAMDAGRVAGKTGALLYGSESTHQIASGDGLPATQMRRLIPDQALPIGRFRFTAIETPHSPGAVFPGLITEPFQYPARLYAFKEAQSYSFWLQHPRGNVLIVPSANYRPGAFAGMKAETVFLGIGGLGKQSEVFLQNYWRESVLQTGAKRVIPVHWDDFGLGLDQPLQAMPYALDRADLGLQRVRDLAARDGVLVQVPKAFERFRL